MKQSYGSNVDMESAYKEYANLVFRFLYSHTHDVDWSQELMQETFLRAVTSISRYDGSCKLSVWLCQIAKHTLWQELRKKKKMSKVALEHILADAGTGSQINTLAALPLRQPLIYRKFTQKYSLLDLDFTNFPYKYNRVEVRCDFYWPYTPVLGKKNRILLYRGERIHD